MQEGTSRLGHGHPGFCLLPLILSNVVTNYVSLHVPATLTNLNVRNGSQEHLADGR